MKNILKKSIALISVILINQQLQASEYLVKYRDVLSVNNFYNYEMEVKSFLPSAQLVKIDISDKNEIQTLVQLFSNSNVEYVVPNYRLYALNAPMGVGVSTSEQNLKEQWSIKKVQAQEAWDLVGNKGSRRVVVAVIDTGVDYKHKNLAPNMVAGYDFIKKNDDPMDVTSSENPGHGTHCAGIVGATGLVEGGTIGLSPEVSIMPLRFLDENGSGSLEGGIEAIDYAISKKVDIISASWGAAVNRTQAKPLIEAIERAEKAGILFVVAASNDGKNNDSFEVYPANAGNKNTISVAASNNSDQKPSWSNYGKKKVHLSSPGESIMSTVPKDKWAQMSGTSMATPLVAGLSALVKSQDLTLQPEDIRALLQISGDPVKIETACNCRVNALKAVQMVKNHKLFIAPYAGSLGVGETIQFKGVYGQGPFTFVSSNSAIATVDTQGLLTGVAAGETTVTISDSSGQSFSSLPILVGNSTPTQPPTNPPSECPYEPSMCDILCQINPSLPYCNKAQI